MSSKSFIWFGMIVGSFLGGLIPALWGGSALSFSGVIFTALGGLAGIYAGFKITRL